MRRRLRLVAPFLVLGIGISISACTGQNGPGQGEPGSTSGQSDSTPVPSRSASGAIEVNAPARGEQVGMPLTVRGRAKVHEGVVNFRLRAAGQVLAQGTGIARAPDAGQFGPFETALSWTVPVSPGSPAELEVFAIRPKDGVPDHVVTIPVIIR